MKLSMSLRIGIGTAFMALWACTAVRADPRASQACQPQISISQSGPSGGIPGSDVGFHVIVKNTGCAEATGLTVVDSLPEGMSYRSSTPQAAAGNGTREIRWENVTVPAWSSISMDVIVHIDAAGGMLSRQVCGEGGPLHGRVCEEVTLEVIEPQHDGEHGWCGAGGDNSDGGGDGGGHDHRAGHGHGGGAGTCACPSGNPCVMEVSSACDVVFTAEQLPARSVIRLVGDPVHACLPIAGPGGTLVSGNGMMIEADNVTLDLNGRRIHSVIPARQASGAMAVTRNTGVLVTGRNVVVSNSGAEPAGVQGFTTNLDFSGTVGGMITGRTRALELSEDHGGGGIRAEGSQALLVDSVRIQSLLPDSGPAVRFSRGYDLEVRSSWIEAMNSGLEITDSEDVRILGNPMIRGQNDGGILLERRVRKAMISGNTIEKNGLYGVRVGRDSNLVRVQGNAIRYNWGYGISVSPRGCVDIITTPNTFWMNLRGDYE